MSIRIRSCLTAFVNVQDVYSQMQSTLGYYYVNDFILGGTRCTIAYGLAEPEKDVWELYEHTRTARKCLPVASILTIAAAGSETSNSSVITRVDTHQKRAYNDDISRPKFALMDPELTKTLPDYQTESGCADIMMHTMERYFTNGGNMELTDALAEGLLRTVMKNAVILHTDPANYEARAEVMWAGSLSHNGLTGCGIASGDFMSHKLEHEMGGMFDVTHGAGLAALWPSWARYVYKDCLPRFVRFARNVMGVTTDGTDDFQLPGEEGGDGVRWHVLCEIEVLLCTLKHQSFLPLRRMVEILCVNLLARSGEAIPIFHAARSILKCKLRRFILGVVIQRKRIDRNRGALVLRSLRISDKLNGQPKGTNHITLTTAVFAVNCNGRKQLYCRRQRNQATFEGTQSGRFHGKHSLIPKGTIVFEAKFNQH